MNRRELRRQVVEERNAPRLRERFVRLDELAGTSTAPAEPLRWRAGRGGRILGVAWCALFVGLDQRPAGATLTDPKDVELFYLMWTSLVAAFVFCRLALWRVTADRDGVFIRRFFSSMFVPWSAISRVELRKDALLEVFGPDGTPMAGFFQPPWLARITRLPGVGGDAADTLTVMARHERLRPTAQADRPAAGTPYVRWAVPLAAVLYVAPLLLPR